MSIRIKSENFNIKRFREKTLGVTQEQLAKALGVSRNCVARWEVKKHKPPEYLFFALRWVEEHGVRLRPRT
jgi:DNA-binding transcriptional regulator YiaG